MEKPAEPGGTGVAVPVVVPWLHVARLRLPLPAPRAVASRAGATVGAVRARLPEPQRVVYYGGLTALAVLGVVEWPVAAAVAAGVWVASHAHDGERTHGQPPAKAPAGRPEPRRSKTAAGSP